MQMLRRRPQSRSPYPNEAKGGAAAGGSETKPEVASNTLRHLVLLFALLNLVVLGARTLQRGSSLVDDLDDSRVAAAGSAKTLPSARGGDRREGAGDPPGANAPTIHIAIFSDRRRQLTAVLRSIARFCGARISVHILSSAGANETALAAEDLLSVVEGRERISAHVHHLPAVTDDLVRQGFRPPWRFPRRIEFREGGTLRTNLWDYDEKHKSPYNLARFYMGSLPFLRGLSRVLFVDDDVIFNGDVTRLWGLRLEPGKSHLASCLLPVWTRECQRYRYGRYSVRETSHMGVGPMRPGDGATCMEGKEQQRGCVPEGFWKTVDSIQLNITGRHYSSEEPAWNYGVTLIDLAAWREHSTSQMFEAWLAANAKHSLFPDTSIGYGLGLPYLVLAGRVQCIQNRLAAVDGLGFVTRSDLAQRESGLHADSLAFHWAGTRKPWGPHFRAVPFAELFAEYDPDPPPRPSASASQGGSGGLPSNGDGGGLPSNGNTTRRRIRRFYRMPDPKPPRSAPMGVALVMATSQMHAGFGEWVMDRLDARERLCASGRSHDRRTGYLRDALMPHSAWQVRQRAQARRRSLRERGDPNNASMDTPSTWLTACHDKSICTWRWFSRWLVDISRDPSICSDHPPNTHTLAYHRGAMCHYWGRVTGRGEVAFADALAHNRPLQAFVAAVAREELPCVCAPRARHVALQTSLEWLSPAHVDRVRDVRGRAVPHDSAVLGALGRLAAEPAQRAPNLLKLRAVKVKNVLLRRNPFESCLAQTLRRRRERRGGRAHSAAAANTSGGCLRPGEAKLKLDVGTCMRHARVYNILQQDAALRLRRGNAATFVVEFSRCMASPGKCVEDLVRFLDPGSEAAAAAGGAGLGRQQSASVTTTTGDRQQRTPHQVNQNSNSSHFNGRRRLSGLIGDGSGSSSAVPIVGCGRGGGDVIRDDSLAELRKAVARSHPSSLRRVMEGQLAELMQPAAA